jgi:hypothetical protein
MLRYKDALAVPDFDLAQQRQAMQSLTQSRTANPKLTAQSNFSVAFRLR